LQQLLSRLATRADNRTEAEIQADVRQFILSAPFQLDEVDIVDVSLESPVGKRQRIDVQAGATVIEVKRDLRRDRVRTEAERQLADYVALRMAETGLRYVGVLTDGVIWNCYDLVEGQLLPVSTLTVTKSLADLERLVVWLEGVLATARDIAPTAQNIESRLGSTSSAYALDRATLASLYKQNKDHGTVRVKRMLWSRLLTSALGTQFEDTDDLFIEHTLLVNTAKVIAHAVLGLPITTLNPTTLLAGEKFDEAGIHGVIESDFFDWVLEVERGDIYVRTLSKRLARFAWGDVEQDVLKVLYESVIGRETRKRLGEYYTPDWLANVVTTSVLPNPLDARVLDPACGSGTFLFHAIRAFIAAAAQRQEPLSDALTAITKSVIGMDLHPVAVTLARVTYLLAIGRERLIDPARGDIHVPVYLGDSLQWQEQNADLWSSGNLVIRTEDRKELFESELMFPDALLDDATRFDQLVAELADRASSKKRDARPPSLKALFSRLAIPEKFHGVVERTFKTMCRLHDEGRDHIWGYYIRNLARPLWLSREGNQVDVIIGNPPWLAYRHMTTEMQQVFRTMSEARGLWAGAEVSTHQDLSALFVVRACELYLKKGGRFGLVLPNAALDRDHYGGFRSGSYGNAKTSTAIAFDRSWDLRRIRPHFFPRAAGVVFGTRVEPAGALPPGTIWAGRRLSEDAEIWSGKLPAPNSSWAAASNHLSRKPGTLRQVGQLTKSPYAPAFTQGATFTPRMAFVVEMQAASPLGVPKGRVAVRSSRSIQEKKPWKDLPDIDGVVETEFIRPFFTGDNVYPYRVGRPFNVVLPCNSQGIIDGQEIDLHPGLQQWWHRATELWEANRANDKMKLIERLNYQSTLSKQLPIVPLRVVYNRAGMHVVAAKISNRRAIIANGLYWAAVQSEQEANYMCAVLNAQVTTELARPFMSYGKDERDIHKHVWELPIPVFDPTSNSHKRIAELGSKMETLAATFEIDADLHFAATRRRMRQKIEATKEGQAIEELVFELIG
jgi:SAM-dependent methyltransferase